MHDAHGAPFGGRYGTILCRIGSATAARPPGIVVAEQLLGRGGGASCPLLELRLSLVRAGTTIQLLRYLAISTAGESID